MKKLILLIVLLLAAPCWSATYYVDATDGNDSKTGLSAELAWKTIAKINSFATTTNFSAGDQILLQRGETWTGDSTLCDGADWDVLDGLTIGAYGEGDKPFLDGDSQRPMNFDNDTGGTLSNLTIENIDISGQDWQAGKASNLWIRDISGITLDGITGDGNYTGNTSDGKNAINLWTCSGTIIIKNCELENWGPSTIPSVTEDFVGITLYTMTTGSYTIYDNTIGYINADCIQISSCTAPGLIYGNTLYNGGEESLDIKNSSNCEIYQNDFYRTVDFTGEGGSGGTKVLAEAYNGANVTFRDNTFHDGDASGVTIQTVENGNIYRNKFDGLAGNIKIADHVSNSNISYNIITNPDAIGTGGREGCIFENNSESGNTIYNNTIYLGTGNATSGIYLASNINTTIKNNLVSWEGASNWCFYAGTAGDPAVVENNCWYNPSNSNKVYYEGSAYGSGNWTTWVASHSGEIYSDPLLTDPSNDVFTLKPGSPCINAGVNLGSDYDDALNPDSTWPDGVLTIDQDIWKTWEIGAYVWPYGGGYKIW